MLAGRGDGIHPGEVEGKEAEPRARARPARRPGHPDWLSEIVLLVVPLFNPDGNDALDPANRRLDLKKLTASPGRWSAPAPRATASTSTATTCARPPPRCASCSSRVHPVGPRPDHRQPRHQRLGAPLPHDRRRPAHRRVGRAEPIALMRERLVPDVIAAVRRRGFDSGWYGNFVEDERTSTPTARSTRGQPRQPRLDDLPAPPALRLQLPRPDQPPRPPARVLQLPAVRAARPHRVGVADRDPRWAAPTPPRSRQVLAASERPPAEVAVRYRLEDPRPAPVEILTYEPRTLEGRPFLCASRTRAQFVGTT
jgi:hypothetical protein